MLSASMRTVTALVAITMLLAFSAAGCGETDLPPTDTEVETPGEPDEVETSAPYPEEAEVNQPSVGESGVGEPPEPTEIEEPRSLLEKLEEQIQWSATEVSLCLYDFDSDTWTEINGRKPIYPASMIKILLMMAILEQVETGMVSLHDIHLLTEADKFVGDTPVSGSGTLQFAEPGTELTVDELLSLMVTISDNVAANILLEQVGLDYVNAKGVRLGLENTAFNRKMYDFESPLPSNVSTTWDLTEMLITLEHSKAAGNRLSEKGISLMKETEDKARIGYYTSSELTLANKVGTASQIIGDMALLYLPHRPPLALTIAVLDPEDQDEAARIVGLLTELIVDHLS